MGCADLVIEKQRASSEYSETRIKCLSFRYTFIETALYNGHMLLNSLRLYHEIFALSFRTLAAFLEHHN